MKRRILAYISLGLCVFLFVVYWVRPDWAAALTISPAWAWLACWFLALPAIRLRSFVFASIAWLAFGIYHVEEYHSLFRSLWPIETVENELRVTSINCSGLITSLADAFQEHPSIILVQESPSQKDICGLLKEKEGYQCVYGIDTSIIVRGQFTDARRSRFYTGAEAVIG